MSATTEAPALREDTAAADRAGRFARWIVFGLCALLFSCSQFYRVANAVVAPDLQRDLHLSHEALGSLSAAFFYAFAAAQIPLALVIDRLGARATMTVLTLVGAVGAVVFATAGSGGAATVGRVLLGVGMSGNLMGSLKLVAQSFPARTFATLAGVIATLGTVGNVLATTPLAVFAGAVGWRHAFLVFAVSTAALALLFHALARERGPEAAVLAAPRAGGSPVAALLGSRDYWILSLGTFCRYGTFLAIQGLWAGPYLIAVAGLSPVRAANLILILNVAAIVGAPIGGWLSDRVLASRKLVMLIALAGTALAQVALALAPARADPWLLALALAFLGLSSSFGMVIYAHMKELVPAPMAGMAMTGVNFFNMLGPAVFLHGMGWIVGRVTGDGGAGAGGYRTAFLAGAAATGIAFLAYLGSRDARPGEPRR